MKAIADPQASVFVSVAAVWEMMIKAADGRLSVPEDPAAMLKRKRFEPLPITLGHALQAAALPPHHRDPFDRMMVAQAQMEGLTLVTRDGVMPRYNVPTLLA